MQEYQKRVVEEKNEVDLKISKLETFVLSKDFRAVDIDERVRMENQLSIMEDYASVLVDRIANF